jgi:prolyl 4-hydroxylase
MFRRIVGETDGDGDGDGDDGVDHYYTTRYNVSVITRPDAAAGTDDMPWIVAVDGFLSEQECQALIDLGAAQGYKRSEDVGPRDFDGSYKGIQTQGRTSTNAWCVEECYRDPVTQAVLSRIENLTAIPDSHGEYLQLLRYEPEQFYERHHDYIPFHRDRAQGVRILTVFLYLNDVEDGGGTHFSDLDVTVQPKAGRALLWPSVRDDDPDRIDHRTYHEALPVGKGIKYGANAWVS